MVALVEYRPKDSGPWQNNGMTEVALRIPSAPRDQVLPVLDDYMQYLAQHVFCVFWMLNDIVGASNVWKDW